MNILDPILCHLCSCNWLLVFQDLKPQIIKKNVANINIDEGQNHQDEQL